MQPVVRHLRQMHSLGPANNDHLSALRVAISVAVPSLVLLLLGRPELTIYAVFGALTGMYGRSEPHQLRLKHQPQAALVLLSGLAVGVFLSVNRLHSWWLVGIEALLAGVGSVYSDKVRLQAQRARSSGSSPWAPAHPSPPPCPGMLRCSSPPAPRRSPCWWVSAAGSAAGPWQPGAARPVIRLHGPSGATR